MSEKYVRNAGRLRTLNREISKAVRKDTRTFNTREVTRVIEGNKGLKSIRRTFTEGKKKISKLRQQDGHLTSNKEDILNVVRSFYQELYSNMNVNVGNINIPTVMNQESEDIPDVTLDELRAGLREIKNNKAAGNDKIEIEAIKLCGTLLHQTLWKLYNACLTSGTTPSHWNRAGMTIMHKKGDITNRKNYRPISLLSHLYKLFKRIITKRIINKLDFYHPRE